jgi:PAS domain S-box-containing protein
VPATVSSRLWAGFLVASIATFALAAPGGEIRQTILGAGLGLASVAAIVAAIDLYQPRPVRPWLLLAAGQLCFAVGDLTAVIWNAPVHSAGFPAASQVLYLAGYPIVTLGFAQLVVRRPLGAGWAVLLDGGILTAGIALLAWVAFGDPIMSAGALSRVDRAVQISFLMCDIALVGVVACLLLGSETKTTSIRLFVLSVVALLVGDGLQRAGGPWTGSVWAAASCVIHYGFWGAAALHPSMSRPARLNVDKAHRMTPARIMTLVGAGLVAPIVLAAQGLASLEPDWAAISLGGVLIVCLAITSMADMVQEQTTAAEKQQHLEERFRQTSETLRAILDSSPLAIVVVDRHRRVLFWSRAAEQLFGYKADEMLGHRSPIVPADQSVEGRALMPRVLAGASVVEQELPGKTKDGRPINVRAHFAPIADEAGHILGAISLMEDTSELDRLQAELFEASKLESVGRLAGGIAHDFNNILTAIIGFAELSIDEPPGTDLSEYVTGIRDAAERAAGLTQQLLAFSRRQMLAPQVLAINEVVSGVESMLRRLIGEQIELQMALDPDAGYLRVDRTQLEQVILNLTLNSRDAMPTGGHLVVQTGHVHYSNVSRSRPRELSAGDYVTISVSDTGVGMDSETRDHIFEPFYTTKPGKGTGLGLATTYGIIKQSGGSVLVDSEPRHGTTFRIYFPVVMREAMPIREPAGRAKGATRDARRSGRILLVEDEEGLRGIAKRVLARAGFEVTAAAGPDEAILAAEAMTEPIDLLVTDVVMPEMRGPELAIRLRSRQPGLRVLLVSGYAEEIVEVGRDASVPFLAKPFSVESLLTAVDAAMDRDSGLSVGEPRSARHPRSGDRRTNGRDRPTLDSHSPVAPPPGAVEPSLPMDPISVGEPFAIEELEEPASEPPDLVESGPSTGGVSG